MAACSPMSASKKPVITCKVMRAAGLDTVFLAAPTSTDAAPETGRRNIPVASSIWFRAPASPGEQNRSRIPLLPLIERMRAHTDLPLAMGFGISKPEHVAALAGHVDAVVVGSAIVRQIERDPSKLEAFMRDLTRRSTSAAIS